MSRMGRLAAVGVLCLGLALPACGSPSKQELLRKAEGATTKAELEKALGKPTKFEGGGLGPITMETWTYTASDGEVVFVIAGNTVISRAAR